MIVLTLKDGLGNQLFQYAAAKSLAAKLKTKVKLDTSSFKKNHLRTYSLNNFSIDEKFISGAEHFLLRAANAISKTLNKAGIKMRSYRYFEQGLEFNPAFFDTKNNSYIEGYWQSEKNFEDIEDIIRKQLQVKSQPDQKNAAIIAQMNASDSVSLHIRRGDYVIDATTNSIHGVCGLDYYEAAIQYIKANVVSPSFFIFSDDMEWVKQNLQIPGSLVAYMDHNGEKDYEDLRLMYSCKHNVIANSSFSWWGAWLNSNGGKIIIAPKNWFKSTRTNSSLLPESWIKL